MEVRAATTADPMAKSSQLEFLPDIVSTSFFSIISIVPTPMSTMPMAPGTDRDSPRSTVARMMVMTVLDLSIGTTLFTSPNLSAL
jgi:hypothetical protein